MSFRASALSALSLASTAFAFGDPGANTTCPDPGKTCQAFGVDFKDGGSYFQNIDLTTDFNITSYFTGCQNTTAYQNLVLPSGNQIACSSVPIGSDGTLETSVCPIEQEDMVTGEYSLLLISNNGNCPGLAAQRNFYVSVGTQATLTVTPQVYFTSTSTPVVISTTTDTITSDFYLPTGTVTSTIPAKKPTHTYKPPVSWVTTTITHSTKYLTIYDLLVQNSFITKNAQCTKDKESQSPDPIATVAPTVGNATTIPLNTAITTDSGVTTTSVPLGTGVTTSSGPVETGAANSTATGSSDPAATGASNSTSTGSSDSTSAGASNSTVVVGASNSTTTSASTAGATNSTATATGSLPLGTGSNSTGSVSAPAPYPVDSSNSSAPALPPFPTAYAADPSNSTTSSTLPPFPIAYTADPVNSTTTPAPALPSFPVAYTADPSNSTTTSALPSAPEAYPTDAPPAYPEDPVNSTTTATTSPKKNKNKKTKSATTLSTVTTSAPFAYVNSSAPAYPTPAPYVKRAAADVLAGLTENMDAFLAARHESFPKIAKRAPEQATITTIITDVNSFSYHTITSTAPTVTVESTNFLTTWTTHTPEPVTLYIKSVTTITEPQVTKTRTRNIRQTTTWVTATKYQTVKIKTTVTDPAKAARCTKNGGTM